MYDLCGNENVLGTLFVLNLLDMEEGLEVGSLVFAYIFPLLVYNLNPDVKRRGTDSHLDGANYRTQSRICIARHLHHISSKILRLFHHRIPCIVTRSPASLDGPCFSK